MSAVLRPNWLHCILCIIIFYLTVLNLILNQFLYHFKTPCFIIFNFLFFIAVNDYFTFFYVKHFELPMCMKCAIQINLPCLALPYTYTIQNYTLMFLLETKMPWRQIPSWNKKAVAFTNETAIAYQGQLNAGFSKLCEILNILYSNKFTAYNF